ncbi:hypothetical protein KFU94_55860 [Chloroflexi bacterium TSY]|nr:hypothetical protein [Chloroflexi bacterium TSY]
MSSITKVVETSTTREDSPVNDIHHIEWLNDPQEAMARERGPYTIENAEQYLDEESVELYNGWLVWQEMTDPVERTLIGTI